MMRRIEGEWFVGLVIVTAVGCAQQSATEPVAVAPASAAATSFLLSDEPAGAKTVIEVRKAAKDKDDVVIVGRIGGSAHPWIKGRAAFSIVDQTLKACSDIPGDDCPIPWDYCCETDKLPTSKALVKFVDDSGSVIKEDARALLNVKELQTVVIRGTAQRDEAGNLTVLANGIFVKK